VIAELPGDRKAFAGLAGALSRLSELLDAHQPGLPPATAVRAVADELTVAARDVPGLLADRADAAGRLFTAAAVSGSRADREAAFTVWTQVDELFTAEARRRGLDVPGLDE